MVDWHERIVSNPGILGGKLVIAGTRVSVEIILEHLAMELTVEEIVRSFPTITRDDVLAALAYASEAAGSEAVAS